MNVLKKLRLQVIFSIVFVLMFILATILFVLDLSVYKRENAGVYHFLQMISDNDGRCPKPKKFQGLPEFDVEKKPVPPGWKNDFPLKIQNFDVVEVRNYFSVRVSENGSLIEVIKDFPLSYTNDEIEHMVNKVFVSEKQRGVDDGIYFSVFPQHEGGFLICFANRQGEISVLHRFYVYSVMIYGASLLAAIIFAWFISGLIVRPVKAAFDKQRQFIADASHELKTPIAVIGANLDVLMPDFEGNRWIGYIKEENERMSHLVKNLLFLARNDAARDLDNVVDFDFSQAVGSAVLPFESVIFEEGKTLELDVEENMTFTGDEDKIKQVIVILVDNAIKNSEKGALIRIRAFSERERRIVTVYNTGEGIPAAEKEKIFLRFYRSDSSRARRTGGYGLGLPIARAIAEKYNGTITVESKVGEWAQFTLTISGKRSSFIL